MKLWAIKWPSGWVDHRSLGSTRRDAWFNFDRENLNWTPAYQEKIRKQRRKGLIRAVKVTLEELP